MLPKRKPQRIKSLNKIVGKSGEDYACELLIKEGFKIRERNFSTKLGEIDIIAENSKVLAFVEVKHRKNTKFGLPEEAVNRKKLQKIKKAALFYLNTHKEIKKEIRVLVVSIISSKDKVIKYNIIEVDEIF